MTTVRRIIRCPDCGWRNPPHWTRISCERCGATLPDPEDPENQQHFKPNLIYAMVHCRVGLPLGPGEPAPRDHPRRPPPPGEEEAIRLWLDDDLEDRPAPEGWLQVVSAHEAKSTLAGGDVVALSLDHDLGDDENRGRGIDVVDYLAEQQEVHGRLLWPREGITLHTANPAGRDQMARAIKHYASRHLRVVESLTPGGHRRFNFEERGGRREAPVAAEPAPNNEGAEEPGRRPTATLTPEQRDRLSIRYGARYVEVMYQGGYAPWDGRDVYLEHVWALRGKQARVAEMQRSRVGAGQQPPDEYGWIEWTFEGLWVAFYVFLLILALGSLGN